jgi:hypothetical protein
MRQSQILVEHGYPVLTAAQVCMYLCGARNDSRRLPACDSMGWDQVDHRTAGHTAAARSRSGYTCVIPTAALLAMVTPLATDGTRGLDGGCRFPVGHVVSETGSTANEDKEEKSGTPHPG